MKPKLLLIDNYDSFTYNLVQAFLVLGADVRVFRNDAIDIARRQGTAAHAPVHLARPGHAVRRGRVDGHDSRVRRKIPVFGVCLGHQSITEVFGGKVVQRRSPHARQDVAGESRWPHAVRRAFAAVRSGALSLAHRAAGVATEGA